MRIAKSSLLRYPVGRKFQRNRSISHSSGDRSKLVFWHFWRKFKMAAIFGERKIFLKIAKTTLLRYPVVRKFRRNRFISHGSGDRSTLMFLHFWQKFENSKWPAFLGRQNFFLKIAKITLLRYPVGRKFQQNCCISQFRR